MTRVSDIDIRTRYEHVELSDKCCICGKAMTESVPQKVYDPPNAKNLAPGAKGKIWSMCRFCKNIVKSTQYREGIPLSEAIRKKKGNVTRYSHDKMANGLRTSHPKYKTIFNTLNLVTMNGGYVYYPDPDGNVIGDEVDYQSWLMYLDKRDLLVKMTLEELKEAIKVFPDKRFGTWVYERFTKP